MKFKVSRRLKNDILEILGVKDRKLKGTISDFSIVAK